MPGPGYTASREAAASVHGSDGYGPPSCRYRRLGAPDEPAASWGRGDPPLTLRVRHRFERQASDLSIEIVDDASPQILNDQRESKMPVRVRYAGMGLPRPTDLGPLQQRSRRPRSHDVRAPFPPLVAWAMVRVARAIRQVSTASVSVAAATSTFAFSAGVPEDRTQGQRAHALEPTPHRTLEADRPGPRRPTRRIVQATARDAGRGEAMVIVTAQTSMAPSNRR